MLYFFWFLNLLDYQAPNGKSNLDLLSLLFIVLNPLVLASHMLSAVLPVPPKLLSLLLWLPVRSCRKVATGSYMFIWPMDTEAPFLERHASGDDLQDLVIDAFEAASNARYHFEFWLYNES
jgi:hypothetical protein